MIRSITRFEYLNQRNTVMINLNLLVIKIKKYYATYFCSEYICIANSGVEDPDCGLGHPDPDPQSGYP